MGWRERGIFQFKNDYEFKGVKKIACHRSNKGGKGQILLNSNLKHVNELEVLTLSREDLVVLRNTVGERVPF
jgi:hypothetical protein